MSHWPILAVLCCGACSGATGGSRLALAPGVYAVSPLLCLSTGETPDYPSAKEKAALLSFDDLKTHTLTVEKYRIVEVFEDEVCRLTLARGVFRNRDTSFSARKNRHYLFSPEGCNLHVTVDHEVWQVGPEFSNAFASNDDLTEDIPFDVAASGPGYRLTSSNQDPWTSLWEGFGCSNPDHIAFDLARL